MDMDLFLLNKLSQLKDGSSGSGATSGSGAYLKNDASINTNNDFAPLATIFGTNVRSSSPSSAWSSSLPYGAYYNYRNNVNDRNQRFWFPQGSVSGDVSFNYHNRMDSAAHWEMGGIQWADRNAVGIGEFVPSHNFNTSYSPIMSRMLFLKNTTDSDITWQPYGGGSSRYSSGYDGSSFNYWVPNSANYTDVTSVNGYTPWTYSSSSWNFTAGFGNITFPAGTTVAMCLVNSAYDWTSTYSIYWVYGHNYLYNLDTMPVGLRCDLKATLAYQTMRDSNKYTGSNQYTAADIVTFFNRIGQVYGNNADDV